MRLIPTGHEVEQQPRTIVVVSAREALQDVDTATVAWADISETSPEFSQQIAERLQQRTDIQKLLDGLPTTTPIDVALANGDITTRQVEAAYAALSAILSDSDYERLVLYLPFELLPSPSWQPHDDYLLQEIEKFKSAYLRAWQHLLNIEDVRANFVDGDVLETHLRVADVPRVVKAAHLIPSLIKHGLLSVDEIIDLYLGIDDSVLKQSIAESLLVLADMGSVYADAVQRCGITYNPIDETKATLEGATTPAASIAVEYEKMLTLLATPLDLEVTENRKLWLERKRFDDSVSALARQIGHILTQNVLQHDELVSVLPFLTDSVAAHVYIESVRQALEQLCIKKRGSNVGLFMQYASDIQALLQSDDPSVVERAKKCLRHANKLGYITDQSLMELGITTSDLAGSVVENLALMPEIIEAVEDLARQIAADPRLSTFMLPVLSLGGSRLKGYGEQTSDIDLCIFIKPGVSYTAREEIRSIIRNFFASHGMDEHPIEFWLEDTDESLRIRDFAADDQLAGGSEWTHILFDTVLIGDEEDTNALIQQLLPNYFKKPELDTFGRSPRTHYLERLEQDLLQYRLLHKGYECHFPRVNCIDVPHANAVDGESMFWDAGYRKVATRLFVNRVFLPKI